MSAIAVTPDLRSLRLHRHTHKFLHFLAFWILILHLKNWHFMGTARVVSPWLPDHLQTSRSAYKASSCTEHHWRWWSISGISHSQRLGVFADSPKQPLRHSCSPTGDLFSLPPLILALDMVWEQPPSLPALISDVKQILQQDLCIVFKNSSLEKEMNVKTSL